MGFLKMASGNHPLPEMVTDIAKSARARWNAGAQFHVYRQTAASYLNAPVLADALDAIAAVGWDLHSQSSHMNTVALNEEVVIYTFVRPRD